MSASAAELIDELITTNTGAHRHPRATRHRIQRSRPLWSGDPAHQHQRERHGLVPHKGILGPRRGKWNTFGGQAVILSLHEQRSGFRISDFHGLCAGVWLHSRAAATQDRAPSSVPLRNMPELRTDSSPVEAAAGPVIASYADIVEAVEKEVVSINSSRTVHQRIEVNPLLGSSSATSRIRTV